MNDGCGDSAAHVATDDEWDAFLQRCFLCHPEQSSPYAANRVEYGYRCDRVVVREKGGIVGGAQILVWPTPFGNHARIFRGPVVLDDDPRLMREVVRRVDQEASAYGYTSVQVDLFPEHKVAHQALQEEGFSPAPDGAQSKESFRIPLAFSNEELMSRMNKNVAYSVRRAIRDKITVRAGGDAPLEDFYKMHEATARHQGFLRFPQEYFTDLWGLLGKRGKVQYFVAYCDDVPLAGIYNVIVGRTMYYNWGGMRWEPEVKKMRVNYLLHMTAMAWARTHGCTFYDLSGIQPFKKQFAIEKVFWPRPLLKCYGSLRGLRWKMHELTASGPRMRRMVKKAARLLGGRQEKKMPW
ncbi:MAG: hypothetical protein C0613_10775 [Desulfobulbaceae bacterium]|nr:MAG: hypothetical protein C0613_10775 [Desulfobulbaceae bacterium]